MNDIYQLKITLKYSKPPIWRRVLVPSNFTLGQLHTIIQTVMGWADYHLHQFTIRRDYYGPNLPDIGPMAYWDEDKVTLGEVVGDGDKFLYEYDFGDSWIHTIKVEKVLPPEPGQQYPVCIRGRRACPPEDVGGMMGYFMFLEIIADPTHPEHEDYRDWLGRDFDPEKFDLEMVNNALRHNFS